MKALKKIGVIGAGQMGNGIAHVCALAGYDVKLNDISEDRIKTGLANINGNMQERTDVSTFPSMDYARYYGYRGRGMYAVPVWTEETRVSQYTEGTLNIDVVDRAQNKMVWEGVAVGRVSKNVKPEERAVRIDAAVADIFAQFPYRAGSGTPVATP